MRRSRCSHWISKWHSPYSQMSKYCRGDIDRRMKYYRSNRYSPGHGLHHMFCLLTKRWLPKLSKVETLPPPKEEERALLEFFSLNASVRYSLACPIDNKNGAPFSGAPFSRHNTPIDSHFSASLYQVFFHVNQQKCKKLIYWLPL